MDWAMTVGNRFASETVPPDDDTATLGVGFAESKYVAERVLHEANRRSGVPVRILHAGQIRSSTIEGDVAFPRQQWLMALIKTSMTMGALPTTVSLIGLDPDQRARRRHP
ncbi:hypothetical protein BDR22DRAFT_888763 [Usnea florida]